jgi:hypothetical protein
MMVINKPDKLTQVQCYKCKTIMNAHPMSNINSPYFTECDIHIENNCSHESDGERYAMCDKKGVLNTVVNKCAKCGDLYD